MSRKLTDVRKWDDDWYLNLTPTMKCAWDYICQNSDGCGFIKLSFGLISYRIKGQVGIEDFKREFSGRIVWLKDDYIWIPGTILISQKKLNSLSAVHLNIANKIIREISDHEAITSLEGKGKEIFSTLIDLTDEARMRAESGTGAAQVPPVPIEERRKKKEEKRIESGESEGNQISEKDLEEFYSHYPRKQGKTPGMRTARAQIKTHDDLERLRQALVHYKLYLKAQGVAKEYVMHFSTFMTQWKDWLDENHGASQDFSTESKASQGSDWLSKVRAVLAACKKVSRYNENAYEELEAILGRDLASLVIKAGGFRKFRDAQPNEFAEKRLAADLKEAAERLANESGGGPKDAA